ncbi:hypothetical protein V9K20_003511 [Vibrio cholerae]|uniref:hypothetical protein n=1 Tax=Vibrio cholerae TaxID=666 RepID=UPI000BA8FC8F|nr:hypothetical protein [Vibrio cholerae]ELH5152261.1 hypothetical protein [Vibrio cholerae]PAR80414.1 hypothetical protein CGT87_05675 [Vibrio cholerae]
MSFFTRKNEDVETENSSKFIPFHHLAIFDRTHEPAKRGEGVVCAIICFTVIEAFINDVIAIYGVFETNAVQIDKKGHPADNYLSDEEISMLEKLRAAEREDIHTKLSIIGEWDKSEKWYQQFSELKRIRNELVHLKSEEIVICKDTGKRSECPKFLNNLLQKNIIARPERLTSWIELLEERKFCLWCQEVTYQILMAAKDKLPDSNVKDYFKRETYFRFINNA